MASANATTSSTSGQPRDVWFYNPSLGLAVAGIILFQIPIVVLAYYLFSSRKGHRHVYFVCVLIAALLEFTGYILRALSIKKPTSVGPYSLSAVLIVVAPLFVAAGLYMLLGRLIPATVPADQTHIYRISPRFLAKVFVSSDVVSFLTQSAGAGLALTRKSTPKMINSGKGVLIAGLSLQIATFSIFLVVVFGFHRRANLVERESPSDGGWKKLLLSVYTAGGLVQIRSVYRLIEFALGFKGYPFTHEWPFYIFDSIPMLVALTIVSIYHPAKYLPNISPYTRRPVNGAGELQNLDETTEGGDTMVERTAPNRE